MLHRDEDFEEYQLAYHAKEYIDLFLRKPDDKIVYVPYRDVPTNSIKYVKFVYEEATGWIYVGNSQNA